MAAAMLLGSLGFALAMALALSVLVIRRWRFERAGPARLEAERRSTRGYLARISDPDALRDDAAPLDARIRAVTHLARLLRGTEREDLVALADRDGLLDGLIADLRSGRVKRRAHAVQTLENLGSDRCVHALRSLMVTETDAEIQLEAASALARLGRLPAPRDTISILRLHETDGSRVHLALFRSLAPGHYPELLRLAVASRFRRLRPLLVEALGWAENRDAFESLPGWSRFPDPAIRRAALMAAMHVGHPRAGAWVLPRLEDPDSSVRAVAAQAAQKLGLNAAQPALQRLLGDPSRWVAVHAERALAEMSAGSPQAG